MKRRLCAVAAMVVCVCAAGPRPAVAQGATSCDSPCKVMHLPLIGPRGAVCDSPCKLINLPLVQQQGYASQAKLPFIVGTVDSLGNVVGGPAYFEYQVDKPAKPMAGNTQPTYPDSGKSGIGDGEVVAAFIVDTLGVPEIASLKILRSTGAVFSAAVRAALPRMRFIPAEKGGVKVRQLVQQPFVFKVVRRP